MKNIILVLSILLFSSDTFSDGVGTKMWDAAVKDNRPVAMLSTLSGMATAPLYIPLLPAMMLIDGHSKTAGDVALAFSVGTGLGIICTIANELFGVVDLCTLGWFSSDGLYTGGNFVVGFADVLVVPAYVWYVDVIDYVIEDSKKNSEKKDEESDEN